MLAGINYCRLLWKLYGMKINTGRTKEQIERLQKKKLEKLLLYAYDYSSYYRRAFEAEGIFREHIRMTPLEKFPVLNKEILMEHFDELVTDSCLKQEELLKFDENAGDDGEIYLGKYHIVHSSGSTGTPRYFVYDHGAWQQMLIGIIRGALWGMSMRSILRLLAEKPKILYIAATDGRYGGAMAVGDGIRGIHAEQKFLDINTPLAKWSEVVREFRPNIIIGYPSVVKILAELTERDKMPLHIKRVISCGEPLSVGLRKFLENAFHAEVINFYGASESLALGVEQWADDGMILFDDLNVIEVIDGEMYVTCLYNFTQPLIRYHISDKLVLHEAKNKKRYRHFEFAKPILLYSKLRQRKSFKENAEHSLNRARRRSIFTRADVLLCRQEDVLWFEKPDGSKEYLHPLSMEGFCVEGLLDYQFCQTSGTSFEMLAETEEAVEPVKIKGEICRQVRKLLADKNLNEIQFSVRFAEQITPDLHTGKKPLIIKMEDKKLRKRFGMEEKMTRMNITGKQFDEERALYHLQNTDVTDCIFAGPADGESALKESEDVGLKNCRFSLRYPLWHVKGFAMEESSMDDKTRAAIWYAENGSITDSVLAGIKAVRECAHIRLERCQVESQEFGWKSQDITLADTDIVSEYLFMDSRDVKLRSVKMKGKYSFQYMENLEIDDCELDTKDAFWHSKNITVRDSIVKGEYLGWFSENLTLINCKIIGTQPLCYCKNLKLVNCTMEDTDLSFEYSDVEADVKGHILSVKNPRSGHVIADSVGEIIRGDAVMECTGEVILRAKPGKEADKTVAVKKNIA